MPTEQEFQALVTRVSNLEAELGRKQNIYDWAKNEPDGEIIKLQSSIGRDKILQKYTDPDTGEIAFWDLDPNGLTPGETGYTGTKVFTITAGT